MSILDLAKGLLSAAAKAVISPVVQHGQRLHAQRQAASGKALPMPDRITAALEETIGALTGRAAKPAWWQAAIAKARQLAINPDDLFFGQSLWAWVDDPQVRRALRALAARRLDGQPVSDADQTDRDLLARKYEELIGDAGASARGRIDIILDVLIAGVLADLSSNPAVRALSVQLQAT